VAPRLSHQMVGVQTEGTCESVNKYLSQMTSAVSSTKALYPASVEERATVCCLLDFHEIGV